MHNGRSATLTAPNGMSQRATMEAALREANLSPTEVCRVVAPPGSKCTRTEAIKS